MKGQLHKRLPLEFVLEVLEAFNDHRLNEEKACGLSDYRPGRMSLFFFMASVNQCQMRR